MSEILNKTDLIILHLSLIYGVGPGAIKYLLERWPKDINLNALYAYSISDFKRNFNFSEILADKIVSGLADKKLLDDELNLILKHKIKWTTFLNPNYPYLLKNIHHPPTILYWQGADLDDNDKKIAVIGSRKADNYGKSAIEFLLKPLIEKNWTIVSGGALGADTMAHKSTLINKGKTIAILGSGLLRPYPSTNKNLFKEIIDCGGTIVSPFPLLMEALPGNFPARNRIISGISKGCIVIQAAVKSGTRITALHALDQGRDVFAIPGRFDDELSAGCHKLIQEGAKLVLNADDILVEYGEKPSESFKPKIINDEILEITDNIDLKIISICKDPASMDELCEKTGLALQEMQVKLFDLQLDGKIQQNLIGMWEAN